MASLYYMLLSTSGYPISQDTWVISSVIIYTMFYKTHLSQEDDLEKSDKGPRIPSFT